ncbi:LysR family transcriptional regulator [Aestuariispira insulae]|uniref:DNA-binding transcriptional LysR family regulator n=1 Tax=Aestuariispira insulae TaxID=1461337 RepID=A0A3D9H471_9PROT|nr:LysR family transcriptional regulator [Aestuariispira insulae]RED44270.1 DNA-binding transcriptional LysR family regulator [Aestuariispira insulae]
MLAIQEEILCFAAICEAGSFTAAAKALGCSKAHVSRKLGELEGRLGIRLLHRSTRRLVLTDAGTRFHEQAVQHYHSAIRLARQAQTLDLGVAGKFVITAPLSLCAYLLAPEMPGLERAFPEVRFHILPSNENLDLAGKGIDMAIRAGSPVDESLIAHPLGAAREVFVGGPAIEAEGHAASLADLHARPLYINPYSMRDGVLSVSNGQQTVDLEPEGAAFISDYALLVDVALRNDGVALAPDYCLAMLEGRGKRCLEPWQGGEWPILMAYPYQSPLPEKLSAVAAYLRPALSKRLESAVE